MHELAKANDKNLLFGVSSWRHCQGELREVGEKMNFLTRRICTMA